MKKIAIVTRRMIAGGIEKALISMLEVMPKDEFNITLFVMGRGGEFEEYIPSHVKIKCLYGEEKSTKEKIISNLKKGNVINALKVAIYMVLAIKVSSGHKEEYYLSKIAPEENEEFDLAIAYHTPASFPVMYISKFLKAKKKVAWIHSDVEVYKNELKRYISYYNKFNKIYCVSKYTKEKFDKQYPYLKSKTDVFYNIINRDKIINLAETEEVFKDKFNGIRILTVARLTKEKGCDIIPQILSELIKEGLNVKWYLVGDGEERNYLSKCITDKQLEDKLILMGTQINPYPYFKSCDIYVQPSRHEGYGITLAEAKIFNKPIITTNSIGALEQIINNETGIIVDFNVWKIKESIKRLIIDFKFKNYITENLLKVLDENTDISKIYELTK